VVAHQLQQQELVFRQQQAQLDAYIQRMAGSPVHSMSPNAAGMVSPASASPTLDFQSQLRAQQQELVLQQQQAQLDSYLRELVFQQQQAQLDSYIQRNAVVSPTNSTTIGSNSPPSSPLSGYASPFTPSSTLRADARPFAPSETIILTPITDCDSDSSSHTPATQKIGFFRAQSKRVEHSSDDEDPAVLQSLALAKQKWAVRATPRSKRRSKSVSAASTVTKKPMAKVALGPDTDSIGFALKRTVVNLGGVDVD
jgi:hypothetical protein